jgi:cellulose synthase/poly-beta-1,6-N-acetylglucosamine synthase-like glycosyltransferase
MQRNAGIMYVARDKVAGVPHHAKAGNINSALLKAPGSGDFILVLDCDMVLHPDFLMRTLPHFYWQPGKPQEAPQCQHSSPCDKEKGAPAATGFHEPVPWVLKDKAAFVQTPQVRAEHCCTQFAFRGSTVAATTAAREFTAVQLH